MARKTQAVNTTGSGSRMMIISVLMAIAGIIMILSATHISARSENVGSFAYLQKQAIRAAVGIVVMLISARIDYHRMRAISFLALVVTGGLLIACLIPGTYGLAPVIGGARRWIHLGPLEFPTLGTGKVLPCLLGIAGYLVRKREMTLQF